MPTYEYRCPDGHEFEKFVQKMSDAQSELTCPACGKVAPRRMSAGGGLVFKGSGFYITDYGKDGKKDQRAATAKSDAGGDAKHGGESKSPADGTAAAPASSSPGAAGTGAGTAAAPATPPAAPSSPTKSAGKSDKPAKGSGPAK